MWLSLRVADVISPPPKAASPWAGLRGALALSPSLPSVQGDLPHPQGPRPAPAISRLVQPALQACLHEFQLESAFQHGLKLCLAPKAFGFLFLSLFPPC